MIDLKTKQNTPPPRPPSKTGNAFFFLQEPFGEIELIIIFFYDLLR